MGRERNGPIERIADAVRGRRFLWVLCKGCGHSARLDPRHLMALAGDLTVRQLQARVRCRRCGKRGRGAVVPDDAWSWPSRD